MIELKHITKKFDEFLCLEDVSIEIPDGSIFGLIGENGAGKSTLLKLLAGIYEADAGEIIIDGLKIPHGKAKEEIFYMPDNRVYKRDDTPLTVGYFYEAFYPKFAVEDYKYLLEQFGLKENALVTSFSKGMKKQMFLSAAFCANTKYLLCDEIFDGLDTQARDKINKIIKDIAATGNRTIVLISHEQDQVEAICTQKGRLQKGKLVVS